MIMTRHSFESYQILRRISGFEKIAQWSAFHHETLSGTGYPFRNDEKGLSTEARVIAVADVFQALAQKRTYRDSLPLEKIISIMTEMAANGNLDPKLVTLISSNAEQCWRYAKCLQPTEDRGNIEKKSAKTAEPIRLDLLGALPGHFRFAFRLRNS